jgi:hypothetical protein
VARDAEGTATITLAVAPEVRPGQRAALLVGDREVLARPLAASAGTLEFALTDAEPGPFAVRLRVEGVDSLLVDRSVTPPVFDPTQRVRVT